MTPTPVLPDQLRVHRALASDALYRVVEVEGDYVTVQVVRAPGLKRGECFRFLTRTVAEMELAADPETDEIDGPWIGPSRIDAHHHRKSAYGLDEDRPAAE